MIYIVLPLLQSPDSTGVAGAGLIAGVTDKAGAEVDVVRRQRSGLG